MANILAMHGSVLFSHHTEIYYWCLADFFFPPTCLNVPYLDDVLSRVFACITALCCCCVCFLSDRSFDDDDSVDGSRPSSAQAAFKVPKVPKKPADSTSSARRPSATGATKMSEYLSHFHTQVKTSGVEGLADFNSGKTNMGITWLS